MNNLFKIVLVVVLSPVVTFAKPAQILLIRHAEKPLSGNSPDLSPAGYQRAEALANIFAARPDLTIFGLPSALFASAYVPGQSSNRPIETLIPLSLKLKLRVQSPYKPEEYDLLARDLLTDQNLIGKSVMVSWVHTYIVQLAQALGSAPSDTWDKNVFDRIWLITFHGDGSVTSEDLPQ